MAKAGPAFPVGALLTGGTSERMGRDKASLKLGDLSVAEWAARAIAVVSPRSIQVGSEALAGIACEFVRDRSPGRGPAAGLEAALHYARSTVIVCALDVPFIPPSLLRYAHRAVRHGALAAAPRWRGRWHPLCAAYAPDALPPLRRRLRAGRADLHGLLDELGALPIQEAALRAFGDPERFLLNINTPEDLERARGLMESD